MPSEFTRRPPKLPADAWLDLNQDEISGVSVVDRYTYRIRVKGKYPQFLYWLAMPFFSPIPVEADRFYAQPGMAERNLSFDWYPVGSGPYMLTVHNPNRQMVLDRNPNFPAEPYPSQGAPGDGEAGLLADAGQPMPFIDRIVFSLEKESIPYWNKFLQGYYDASGITSDTFDQVIRVTGTATRSSPPRCRSRGSSCRPRSPPASCTWGSTCSTPWWAGTPSARASSARPSRSPSTRRSSSPSSSTAGASPRKGRSRPGSSATRRAKPGLDRYVYDWVDGEPRRKSIDAAKQLLAEAGYPRGIDRETGKPLIIYFDSTMSGVGAKARTDWLIKQLSQIDLQLVMRSTDYNRFQEKMRKGTEQLYYWGWNADYPDPENFLFLFYGPQGKVKFSGENASNYANPQFDRLFERMREMENSPARQAMVSEMMRDPAARCAVGVGLLSEGLRRWRISGCTTASPTRWPTTR